MDNLANSFSTIQNSQIRRKRFVYLKFSKIMWNICTVLTIEGFIQGFERMDHHILVYLKYFQDKPVIKKILKISLQSRRIYTPKMVESNSKSRTLKGLGIQILSTSKGILSCRDARFYGVGGEILCSVSS